jgi:hypothetical protein
MKRLLLHALSAVFFVAGCAGHFYREEADRVHLYLRDGRAGEVQFASSLDGFGLHRINKVDAKTWVMTVPKSGEFRYFYLVDGRIYFPDCQYREMDDFGSYNCLYKPDPQGANTN